jgi:hypothetical protein
MAARRVGTNRVLTPILLLRYVFVVFIVLFIVLLARRRSLREGSGRRGNGYRELMRMFSVGVLVWTLNHSAGEGRSPLVWPARDAG